MRRILVRACAADSFGAAPCANAALSRTQRACVPTQPGFPLPPDPTPER